DQINNAPRRADFPLRLCVFASLRELFFWEIPSVDRPSFGTADQFRIGLDQGWDLSSRKWVGGMSSRKGAKTQRILSAIATPSAVEAKARSRRPQMRGK